MKTNRSYWSSSFRVFCAILTGAVLFGVRAPSVSAATNDLTSTLQKGLFEEEANRNLDAAIAAYQSLLTQFDKDRQVAATAAFRLGECYRKLGRTNDAIGQYERVIQEFSDQTTLATLSRQNLTGLGATMSKSIPESSEGTLTSLQNHIQLLQLQLEQGKALRGPSGFTWDGIHSLARIFDDERYRRALENYTNVLHNTDEAEKAFFRQNTNSSVQEREQFVKQQSQSRKQVVAELNTARDEMFKAKESEIARLQSALLKAQLEGVATVPTDSVETTAEEQQEIRRIQTMIQNSPDLINATDAEGSTPLMRAAGKGQLTVARYLLNHGADVNFQKNNRSALLDAVKNGHKTMVELLLAGGADVNAGAPLADAVWRQFPGVVEVLLANKADVNKPASNGMRPLHLAADNGNVALIKLLLAHKADINARNKLEESPLMQALLRSDGEVPAILLAAGPDLKATNHAGGTALHYTATFARPILATGLLAAGADITAKDATGRTPLHAASTFEYNFNERQPQQQLDVISILLSHGASVNATDNTGKTPLALALADKNTAVVKLLLDHKADPDWVGFVKLPPANLASPASFGSAIFIALATMNTEALQALLAHGANPEISTDPSRSKLRERPLMMAIRAQQTEAVRLLLRYKADPNRPDAGLPEGSLPQPSGSKPEAELPLQRAITAGSAEIVQLLLDAGANPNARPESGNVLLASAVYNTTAANSIPKMLLAHGADVNARDSRNNRPLHLAVFGAKLDAVALLIASNALVNVQNEVGLSPLDIAVSGQSGSMRLGVLGPRSINPPQTVPVDPSAMQKISALLREHGARDDLPRLDRIETRRPSANVSEVTFQQGTNDWNRFSLLELIACNYRFLSTNLYWIADTRPMGMSLPLREFPQEDPLRFPDFKNIIIHRPSGDNWKSISVDVAAILASHECSRDVWLQWGDVVEIPAADRPMSDVWGGLMGEDSSALIGCVSRTINIVIHGKSTEIKIIPEYSMAHAGGLEAPLIINAIKPASFMVRSVLDRSRLIRFSSDLSRVKVTRRDSTNGKTKEWILDCSDPYRSPDFWLRDGDVVEIPEK